MIRYPPFRLWKAAGGGDADCAGLGGSWDVLGVHKTNPCKFGDFHRTWNHHFQIPAVKRLGVRWGVCKYKYKYRYEVYLDVFFLPLSRCFSWLSLFLSWLLLSLILCFFLPHLTLSRLMVLPNVILWQTYDAVFTNKLADTQRRLKHNQILKKKNAHTHTHTWTSPNHHASKYFATWVTEYCLFGGCKFSPLIISTIPSFSRWNRCKGHLGSLGIWPFCRYPTVDFWIKSV